MSKWGKIKKIHFVVVVAFSSFYVVMVPAKDQSLSNLHFKKSKKSRNLIVDC